MARQKHLRLIVTAIWIIWGVWYLVGGSTSTALTVVDDSGQPVAGASIRDGDRDLAVTDGSGAAVVQLDRGARTFVVTAPGYLDTELHLSPDTGPEEIVRVRPSLLRGTIVDREGLPVPHVTILAGYGKAVTDRRGEFMLRLAEAGPVKIERPGWRPVELSWDGSPGSRTITLEPLTIKAVHVTGEAAGDSARWAELTQMTKDTELNGIMLDLKDEYGLVYYDTAVETAIRAGAVYPTYDLGELARELDERGIHLIGRIVTFQDPQVAVAIPELAVGNSATGGVFHKGGQYFLDPTDPEARRYGLDLAEEACRLGVDEIQFDYIRYPDGFGASAVFDAGASADVRVEAIRGFIVEAREILHPLGCAVAGDIFGFITTQIGDGGIGQQWEVVTAELDVVSPMVYPSHYDSGWYGFDRPVAHPGGMVLRALKDGVGRLEVATVIRPWLQDFGYDKDQVRAQIEAAETYGLGWMLWNAKSIITEEALQPG